MALLRELAQRVAILLGSRGGDLQRTFGLGVGWRIPFSVSTARTRSPAFRRSRSAMPFGTVALTESPARRSVTCLVMGEASRKLLRQPARRELHVVGSSRFRYAEIPAYLPHKVIVDFRVARNRRSLSSGSIDVDGVPAAFAKQFASVLFKMVDKRPALHAPTLIGSRMTSPPSVVSSINSRLASRTMAMAS